MATASLRASAMASACSSVNGPAGNVAAAGCGDAGACATTLRDVSVHAASASTNTMRLVRDRRRE